jgi:type III secretion protein Q
MALPFETPTISRGFAELTHAASDAGVAAAEAATSALSQLLGTEVCFRATAMPGLAALAVGAARVAVGLESVPAVAVLEVDAALAAAALGRVAGGDGRLPAALRATAIEQSLFELLALVALDACATTALERLAPRLIGEGDPARDALTIALDITLGAHRGRGRLLVPPAVLRALASAPALEPAASALAMDASFRQGEAALTWDELAALEPGDAVVVGAGAEAIVLPGGLAIHGHSEAGLFHVEEIGMTQTQAAYPITIAVELGRVTITLGELARLEPGAALPLDLRRDGTVVLRAGERAIARGQLVDIDGTLGVRVAQLGDGP